MKLYVVYIMSTMLIGQRYMYYSPMYTEGSYTIQQQHWSLFQDGEIQCS